MYNVGADYAVVGRVTTGTAVEGYIIIGRNNQSNKFFINKSEFEILALSKKVYNCTAQVYNDYVILKGINCKISKLPRYTRECVPIIEPKPVKPVNQATIKLEYKVRNGREVIGYIVKEKLPNGEIVTVYKNRDDIVKAAADNKVFGVKCQSNAGRFILRAVDGYSLNQIPEMTIEEYKKKRQLTLI